MMIIAARIEATRRVRIAFPSNHHDRNTADIKEAPDVRPGLPRRKIMRSRDQGALDAKC
jgi:hypothetical protein